MKLNYEDMLALCEQKEEFRAKEEIVDGGSVTIFSCMVSKSDTFDSELAKEFRGTTFLTDTKECISRPLPKFFNVNERDDTQENKIDWCNAEFYTKHDGSMAVPVLINDKIFWKTKKSFYSDVALKIQEFYDNNGLSEFTEFRLKKFLKYFTPLFEYVGSTNRIVLEYEKEDLIYLGYRNLKTGEYVPSEKLRIKNINYKDVYDMKGIEGFVIWDGNQLAKAKTKEYIENHKIVSEFNPKTIIESTLNDTIDDMLGMVSQLGFTLRYYQIQQLRDEVVDAELEILRDINDSWEKCKKYKNNRKEFAQCVTENIDGRMKSFMFLMIDEKDITEKLQKLVFDVVYERYKG